MLSTSKIAEVSQKSFVFDVVKFKIEIDRQTDRTTTTTTTTSTSTQQQQLLLLLLLLLQQQQQQLLLLLLPPLLPPPPPTTLRYTTTTPHYTTTTLLHTHYTRLHSFSARHSTFHFWGTSCRTASFLTLPRSKIEEVSQNCFVFDVANYNCNYTIYTNYNYI